MPKPEEQDKASERGQVLSAAEEALEDARDALHAAVKGKKSDPVAKEAFKAAQEAVRAERYSVRQAREAAGPPPEAQDIQRDGAGRITGWTTTTGDVAVAQGGVDG